jgi:uncharacterized protein
MNPPAVVLDKNTVVSAALKPEGLEAQVVVLVVMRQLTMCASAAVMEEYFNVLSRPKFGRIDPRRIVKLLNLLQSEAKAVAPVRRCSACPHEPDNRFLECAEAASADFLVTGNKRHFPDRWRSTRIVNAREFLNAIRLRTDL